MAVVSNMTSVRVNVKLNNGTVDGRVKTLNVGLGNLNVTRYEDDKAMNIVNALSPCMARSVYTVQKTAVSTLSEE